MTYTKNGLTYLTKDDMVIVKKETVLANCRCCGELAYVMRTVAKTGRVNYSKCGRCYL